MHLPCRSFSSLALGAAIALGVSGCHSSTDTDHATPTAATTQRSFRRLTAAQYGYLVHDALGVSLEPGLLPSDAQTTTGTPLRVSVSDAEERAYLRVAALVTERASRLPVWASLTACQATGSGGTTGTGGSAGTTGSGATISIDAGAGCLDAALAPALAVLWRRPATADEQGRLRALYTKTRQSSVGSDALPPVDHAGAVRVVVQAALNVPAFLYDDLAGAAQPSGLGMAARLSLFLHQSAPDQALLDAAAQGKLDTREGVEQEARRLFLEGASGEQRTGRMLRAFTRGWLRVDSVASIGKSVPLYPEFNDTVRQTAAREPEAFVEHVVLQGDGRFETLFTAPYSFVNASLAPLYGLPREPFDPLSLKKADLDPTQRAGLVTQIALLALTGHAQLPSPTLRGKFIRDRFLCEVMPPPPPNINTSPLPTDLTATTRDQYREHTVDPSCRACHLRMDPLGVGLERYSTAGQYSLFEMGHPVTGAGAVYASQDLDGAFSGAVELASKLAASREAQDCFVRHVVRFALGRAEHTARDLATVVDLQQRFQASGHDVRDLFVAMSGSEAFRSDAEGTTP